MLRKLFTRTAALALLGALIVAEAAGLSAVCTITLPTQYVDGTTLPSTDIASVTVEWRRTAGGAIAGTVTSTGPVATLTVPVTCGGWVFDAYVTTTSTATYPSAPSADSSPPQSYATGVACAPNPPGLGVH